MEAITTRIWPMMISAARLRISSRVRPSRRAAAFCMISGRVEMPTMKEEGTSTRMFWEDRAPCKGTSMLIGFRSR